MILFIRSNLTIDIDRALTQLDRATGWLGWNVPPLVSLKQLQAFPTGSFGRAWATFLDANQLTLFDSGLQRKQLHDGVHVLTGYGTDPIGEAELQAFLLGCSFGVAHVALVLGLMGMMHRRGLITNTRDRQQVYQRLRQAYDRGRQSQFDPDGWLPEQLCPLPLSEARHLAGL